VDHVQTTVIHRLSVTFIRLILFFFVSRVIVVITIVEFDIAKSIPGSVPGSQDLRTLVCTELKKRILLKTVQHRFMSMIKGFHLCNMKKDIEVRIMDA